MNDVSQETYMGRLGDVTWNDLLVHVLEMFFDSTSKKLA